MRIVYAVLLGKPQKVLGNIMCWKSAVSSRNWQVMSNRFSENFLSIT